MHFVTLIPDWNSLDSVRHAHSVLEAAALVFFALLVLFDVLAHFSEDRKRERLLEKVGLCFFAVAVFAELAAYPYGQRNDALSAQVIGSLSDKADEADKKAKEAISDSSIALSQAKDALTKSQDAMTKVEAAEASLGNAEREAKNAQIAASNALALARDTRKEADSFAQDIVAAKRLATDAESHLADALQKAANAQAELNRLTTPRVLLTPSEVSKALKAFRGTEYTFSSVFQEGQAIELLKQIDSALQLAEWNRVPFQAPPGGIMITINSGLKVPPGVTTGVLISAEAPDNAESLRSLPTEKLPEWIRVAVVLRSVLAASISPSQGDLGKDVIVSPGNSRVIRIDVGKHP